MVINHLELTSGVESYMDFGAKFSWKVTEFWGESKFWILPFLLLFFSPDQPNPSHQQINQVWAPSLKFLGEHLCGLSVFADGQHVLLKTMSSWWCLCHPGARGDLIVWEKQAKSAEDDFMGTKLQRTADKKPIQLMHFPGLFRQMVHTI